MQRRSNYKSPAGGLLVIIYVLWNIINTLRYGGKLSFVYIVSNLCLVALAVVVLMRSRGFLVLATSGLVSLFYLINFIGAFKNLSAMNIIVVLLELMTFGCIALMALDDFGFRIFSRSLVKRTLLAAGGVNVLLYIINSRFWVYMEYDSGFIFRNFIFSLFYYIGILLIGLWVANPYRRSRG